MKTWTQSAALSLALIGLVAPNLATPATAQDLREAVPPEMFLAVHGRHNPERDYQKQYYREVWEAVEQSRLPERIFQIIQSRMSDDEVGKMLAVRDSIRAALQPVQWDQLLDCSEVIYAQKMEGIQTQNVFIMRLPDGAAASLVEGIGNLFRMADEAAGDDISVLESSHAGAQLLSLKLPLQGPQASLTPTIGVRGDLFIYSSNPELAAQCLSLLDTPEAASKFDDPRVKEALTHLPDPEDSLVFFDGVALSQQLKGIVAFIQDVGAGNDEAERIAGLMDSLMQQARIIDSEITVEYTDGYRNLTASLGTAVEGYESTVLGRMVTSQQSFPDWSSWIPAQASGFAMTGGCNLHPLYEWVTTTVPQVFPKSQVAFDRFQAIQQKYDLFLDADLLQSFSGESVSVRLPGPLTPLGPSEKSVTFLRCEKPDRIRSLIHRGIEALQQIPQVQAQGLTLTESETLEGFEELNAGVFAMLGGMKPIFGFQDGWMAIASHADALDQVLQTRQGEADNIASTETFTQFGIDVDGDVKSISYSNTGETIRRVSQGLQQAGAMVPLIIGMAGQGANAPDLGPLQDVLGFLPSIGRVISKFDFVESTLSVTQPGPSAGTWMRRNVVLIRPPAAESAATP